MKKAWNWISLRLKHKLEHLNPSRLLDTLKEHGIALVIIIIGWEIIEDVLFPILFIFLGNHVHPAFYAGDQQLGCCVCTGWQYQYYGEHGLK